ncbi:MAG: gliding motility-associated C-terminal domain-containing protein, partial [Chitinophagaceae bacterium]
AHITISNSVTSEFSVTTCKNYDLPWGTSISSTGDYTHTYQTVDGCDSLVTAQITISNSVTSEFSVTTCKNYDLPWGTSISSTGDYTHTYQTANSCDSLVTAHITISTIVTSEFTTTACKEYKLPWDSTVSASGDYTHLYQTANGCDSLVTAHITLSTIVTSEFTTTVCKSYKLPWDSIVNASGIYIHLYQTIGGCDSIVTAHITINSVLSTQFSITSCKSYKLPWDSTVTSSGNYIHLYQSVSGCDSVVTARITITSAVATQFSIAACKSYKLPWDSTVTSSGNYFHLYQTISGCDSSVTAKITITTTLTTEFSIVACKSYKLPWDSTVTSSGNYIHLYQTTSGCDSIVTALIIITNTLTTEFTITACKSYKLPWDSTVLSSGDYTRFYQTISGCDSVVTAHVTIGTTPSTQLSFTSCKSYRLPWDSTVILGGTYSHLYQTISGCDSLVSVRVTITADTGSDTDVIACKSYTWNGNTYNTSGNYIFTAKNALGCDSIATLHLVISRTLTSSTSQAICAKELPFTWNGHSYLKAGTYSDTLKSILGCDSIAILNLAVTPTLTINENISTCGASYLLRNGVVATSSGSYISVVKNDAGCDTTFTTNLTLQKAPALVLNNQSICISETADLTAASFTKGSDTGLIYTYWSDAGATNILGDPKTVSAGTYYIKATTLGGCTIVRPLVIAAIELPKFQVTNPASICAPGTLNLRASAITAGNLPDLKYTYFTDAAGLLPLDNPGSVKTSGTYYIKARTSGGCSIIAPVIATINPLPKLLISSSDLLCGVASVDITKAAVTTGSDAALLFTYWTDSNSTNSITTPKAVSAAGTYYIMGTNLNNCSVILPLTLIRASPVQMNVKNPAAVCAPGVVDLTSPDITGTSATGSILSYWTDQNASTPLNNPNLISISGTYFIKASQQGMCSTILPVTVTIKTAPALIITNPASVCAPSTVDITSPAIIAGSAPGSTFTYWSNASATTPLINPKAITVSGTYYIQAIGEGGCATISPVVITVNQLPAATISGGGTICAGTSTTLQIALTGNAPWTISYTDGIRTYIINAITSSPYQLVVSPASNSIYSIKSVTSGSCTNKSGSSSAAVTIIQQVKAIRYPTVSTPSNTRTQLQARVLGNNYTYSWNPPKALTLSSVYNPVFNYDRETEYKITITSPAGCLVTDTLLVTMRIVSDLFVPKAWSPNKDGFNDKLYPLPVNILELRYFRIFNRWGQLVFETNKLLDGWDGIFNGKPQASDVYTWTVEAVGVDGKFYKRSGNSILLR